MNTIIQLLRGQLPKKEENCIFLTISDMCDNIRARQRKEQFNYLMREDSKHWMTEG